MRSGRDRAAVWGQRLERYRQAGQTVAEFCRQEGVSVPSFYQWRQRLAQPSRGQRPKRAPGRHAHRAPAFQQVMLSGGVVTAVLPSGARLEVPAQQVELVRAVLAELLQAEAAFGQGGV
jgi:transposase-like protein